MVGKEGVFVCTQPNKTIGYALKRVLRGELSVLERIENNVVYGNLWRDWEREVVDGVGVQGTI